MSPILFNFIVTAIVVLSLIYTVWVIHLKIDDSSIIDLIWGLGFGLVALVLLWANLPVTPYKVLLTLLPLFWALRYTTFIFLRNLGHGEDDRYTHLRKKVAKKGYNWPLYSFLAVYGFQAASMLIVCLTLIVGFAAADTVTIGVWAIAGTALWTIGFFFEAIGDLQLEMFKKKHRDYDGPYAEKPVMNSGLWRYSRHPNYFGNACMWWGIGLIVVETSAQMGWHWGYTALLGSAYMNFALVFLTGKANNEAKMKKRPAYREYIKNTSGFIPWPPKG